MHHTIIRYKIFPYITLGVSIIMVGYNFYVNVNKLISIQWH